MRDYIYLGSAPSDEVCSQVGEENYLEISKQECTAYKNQILRVLEGYTGSKNLPTGFSISIKIEQHELGSYREVVASFNTDNSKSWDLSTWLEDNIPVAWDDEAKKELLPDDL